MFHGLAFANFNAPHEARAAVSALHNFELEGRRLRVELKKRLPAAEQQRNELTQRSRLQPTDQNSLPAAIGGGQRVEGHSVVEGDMLGPLIRPEIVPLGSVTPLLISTFPLLI